MARPRRTSLRLLTAASVLLAVLSPALAWADAVALRAGERGSGARLVFEWPQAVQHSARLSGNQVRLTFARPIETDLAGLSTRLSAWVEGASRSGDGREVTITLKRSARLQSFASGNRVIVDLTPGAAATTPAPEAEAMPAARDAQLRLGRHAGYDRAVFTFAGRANAVQEGDKLTITAPPVRRLSERQLQQLRALPQVAAAGQEVGRDRLTLTITLKPGASATSFRAAGSLAVDFKDAAAIVADTAPRPTPAPARPPVEAAPLTPPPAASASAAPETPAPVDTVAPSPATTEPAPVVAAPATPQATTTPATGEPVPQAVAASAFYDAELPPLEMSVPKDTPLAVFRRGTQLFVVVSDKNTPRELIPLVGAALAASPRVSLLPAQGGRVIRIDLEGKTAEPVITASPTGWTVSFEAAPGAIAPLEVREEPDYSLGPRLFVKTAKPANPVLFADPLVGDTLAVVPLPTPANGMAQLIRTVQSELLPSAQGLVIKSWTEDLNVISSPDGVEISAISGFKLAERLAGEPDPVTEAQQRQQQQQQGESAAPVQTAFLPVLLDFAALGKGLSGTFTAQRQKLQNELIAASEPDKPAVWLRLATLYFMNGMASEAAALYQDLARRQEEIAKRPEFNLIRAIGAFSAGTTDNIKAALAGVNQPSSDLLLWQGMLAAREGNWAEAQERFKPALARIWDYPEPYQSRLAITATEAAIESKDYPTAELLLARLNERAQAGGKRLLPAAEYLAGALNWGKNRVDEARANLGSAAQSWNQLWRTKAELLLVDADLKDNRTRPADITKRLERLRFAWRGDALEFEILHKLARQHIKTGEFAAAFEDFSQMAEKFPALSEREKIVDEQKAAFTRIFQGDDRDRTPAYSQLAIWDRYRQFRPTQPSVLDDINSYMAERVAGIDLLDRAADFYGEVLKSTTDPAARAALGTKLAGLRLLDHKYDEALKALADTEPAQAASQPSVLREDAKDERRQLRARAVFGLGKPDEALGLLVNDYSEPATRLRADINWKTRRWAEAADALNALIGTPPEGQPLTGEKSGLILNRATALALSGDRTGLRDLRVKFGGPMSQTVDGTAFSLLTRPEVAGGLPDRATLQGRVAEVDLFQKFLERYRSPASVAPEGQSAAAHP